MQTNKKILLVALAVLIAVVAVFYFLKLSAQKSAQKLAQLRKDSLAAVQTALDKHQDCLSALPQLNNYLSQKSADSQVWLAKAICEFQSNKYAEAKTSFEKVIELELNADERTQFDRSLLHVKELAAKVDKLL